MILALYWNLLVEKSFFVIHSPLLEFTRLGVSLAHEKPLSLEKKNISKWSGVRTTNIEHQKRTLYQIRYLT